MTNTAFFELVTRSAAESAARIEALWRMTPTERVAAMRRGDLTMEQCCAWASRYPAQVPLVNGEWEFIAVYMPEACE